MGANLEVTRPAENGGGMFGFADRIDARNTTVLRNRAVAGTGGGVSASSLILLADSRVSLNRSGGSGGGVHSGSAVSMTNTTLDGNIAAGWWAGQQRRRRRVDQPQLLPEFSRVWRRHRPPGPRRSVDSGGSVLTNSATDGGGIYAADNDDGCPADRAGQFRRAEGAAPTSLSRRAASSRQPGSSPTARAQAEAESDGRQYRHHQQCHRAQYVPWGAGGGILADYYADGLSRVEIERATLKANTAGAGGGAYIASLARVASSSLTGNLSNGHWWRPVRSQYRCGPGTRAGEQHVGRQRGRHPRRRDLRRRFAPVTRHREFHDRGELRQQQSDRPGARRWHLQQPGRGVCGLCRLHLKHDRRREHVSDRVHPWVRGLQPERLRRECLHPLRAYRHLVRLLALARHPG